MAGDSVTAGVLNAFVGFPRARRRPFSFWTIYSMFGWFVLLLVRLYEREVLLASSDEQYSYEGTGQPSQSSDHAAS